MLCSTRPNFPVSLYIADGDICVSPQDNQLTTNVLSELGVQLGLCDAGSLEAQQLTNDYLSFTKTLNEEQSRTDGHCWAKVK